MKRIVVLVAILTVLVGGLVLLAQNPAEIILPEYLAYVEPIVFEEGISLTVAFSEDGHFFPHGVTVGIFASEENATIHYTLDGSFPTTYSEIYTEPLRFDTYGRTNLITLRAIAVYGDEVTAPLTHTYFIGVGVADRFDTLVFSITTNRDYLYCFYEGIFVYGVTRRDHVRANPGQHLNPTAPANFNWRGRESERPIHLEVFHPHGERVLSQAAGVRVFGSWSRGENINSLRLIARREYSPHAGRFHYEFFPGDLMMDGFGTPITAYNTLILRNGGNDRMHGNIRNELGSVLARRGGFNHVTPVRPATLFINGRYYGFMWLQTRFDEHYLQEMYGTPARDFDVVSRGEWWFRNATEEQQEALTYKNNFAWRDLNNDTEFAALNAIVCVDDLLWYYAFQIFLGNADWPNNNLRRWRYTGEPFEGMAEELDGRWRYAIFDLDQTFGLFGQNYRRPTFQYVLMNNNDRGQLIRNILTRPDMAERFTMMMNDIAANVVNYAIVSEVLNELYGAAYREIGLTINANLYNPWVSRQSIQVYHDRTLEFAARRHIFINESLVQKFGFENDMFNIYVTGGEAIIGTARGTQSRYFSHLTIPVRPYLPEFTAFYHWRVNGVRTYDYELAITFADTINRRVDIELFTRPDFPQAIIYTAFDTPQGNGLTLTNPTNSRIQTSGLYLSNRRHELQRFPLPAATIQPGGMLQFSGSGGNQLDALFNIRLNFNVRQGRRVFLSDAYGNILHTYLIR